MNKVIFLYDYTGIAAKPWLENGYECYIFDGQHKEGETIEGNLHKIGMWLERDQKTLDKIIEYVGDGVVFVGGWPECTDMAVSGAAHFKKKLEKDPDCQKRAASRAMLVEDLANYYNSPWFAENPVSVLSTLWRKPNYSFHPYEYSNYLPSDDVHPKYPEYITPRDNYPKKTCLWTGNGFIMPIKDFDSKPEGYSLQHSKLGGKSLKTKNIRSATPRGFSMALFLVNRREEHNEKID